MELNCTARPRLGAVQAGLARRAFLKQFAWAAGASVLPAGFVLRSNEGLARIEMQQLADQLRGVLALHWDQPFFSTYGGAHPYQPQAIALNQPHAEWTETDWRMRHPYL